MNRTPDYYVNKEKGTVACVLRGCTVDAVVELSDIESISVGMQQGIPKDFLMHDTYTGVAVCKEGDTFDEQFGRELAYRIAYTKYRNALRKKAGYIMNDYEKYTKTVIQKMADVYKRLAAKQIKSQELLKETKAKI